MSYDWTRFSITFFYDAPLDEVFRAWATARGLESFFIKEARFSRRAPDELVQPGDRYEWRYVHDFGHGGDVLWIEENASVAYTFGDMRVDVALTDTGDGVRVDLTQTGIPETDWGRERGHLNCRSCWLYFMTNLKSVLEHGVDLRDHAHPSRASSMEVEFSG